MSPARDASAPAPAASELDGPDGPDSTASIAFSTRHAYWMLGGVALDLLYASSWPLALTALASFGLLLLQQRATFEARGFGAANWVTSARLLSLLLLAALFDARLPLLAAALAWSIFALDWLDGYLARRFHAASSFGALYDSEVDAGFTMLLTAGVYQLERAGAWVLIGGLLRYAYALSLHLSGVREREAPRTSLGRYVFGLSIGGYALSLWPFYGSAASALCAAATLLLCYSFSRSFLWTFAPRRKPAEPQ